MLYSRGQQFVATLLLFSILLQSCGHPNCQMVAPVHPSAHGQASKPQSCTPFTSVHRQLDASELYSTPKLYRSTEALSAEASKVTYVPAFAPSRARATEARGRPRTLFATAVRSPVASSRQLAQSARPFSGRKKPSAHVIPKTPVSQNTPHREKQEGNTPPLTRSAQLSHSPQRVAHQPQTESKPTPRNIVAYPEASSTAPRHAPTPFYPSAQGHQVRFQAEEGKWQAQVQDVWGREQVLPVLCAPDQTPARAIEQLSNKALGQHKYWVHVLETDQSPWAPRVVYVGALGLRGGMPSKKKCTYDASKWKTHSDGSRTCPSGQHYVTAPRASRPGPSSSDSPPVASTTPYSIGSGVTYDPAAMGGNLAGLLRLFGGKEHSYREDPSVQRRIQEIEESTQELERKNEAVARRENQRQREDQDGHDAAIKKSKEAWEKARTEEGEERNKPYRNDISVSAIRDDIDNLRIALANYPALNSALPREVEEDIHITLGYIAKEEVEFADFARRTADIPPGGGTQWSTDYYNFRGENKARVLLQSIKDEMDAIIAERSDVLAISAFASVREAARRVAQTMQAKVALRQSLQHAVKTYQKTCMEDEEFQQFRSTLAQLVERLKQDANNNELANRYETQEVLFKACPLYKEGVQLALIAQGLREEELERAAHIIPSKFEMNIGVGAKKLEQRVLHTKEAQIIRDKLLQPVRAILLRPSTPPRPRLTVQAVRGAVENAVDTAKLAVDLSILAGKILGGAVHSLVTWENKLGIGEKITDCSVLVNALFQEWQYAWESPSEYQARLKAATKYRRVLDRAESALNAEVYHNRNAHETGYWSLEALQWVFGEAIIKGTGKVVGCTAKGAQSPAARENTEEDRKMPAVLPWRGVPFAQQEAPGPDLAALLQRNLQLHEPAAGDQAQEDRKVPNLPHVTTFNTLEAAQEAVEAYLERFHLETLAGRAALHEQGQEILNGVEALEKETASYPLVWDRVLEEQATTRVQLNRLTGSVAARSTATNDSLSYTKRRCRGPRRGR